MELNLILATIDDSHEAAIVLVESEPPSDESDEENKNE